MDEKSEGALALPNTEIIYYNNPTEHIKLKTKANIQDIQAMFNLLAEVVVLDGFLSLYDFCYYLGLGQYIVNNEYSKAFGWFSQPFIKCIHDTDLDGQTMFITLTDLEYNLHWNSIRVRWDI
jgi:hypothetical protein